MKSIAMGCGGYIYLREGASERETGTSKSAVSSSDLAVDYDDECGVKNDGGLGGVATTRTGCG
jgi:hypothetical protein